MDGVNKPDENGVSESSSVQNTENTAEIVVGDITYKIYRLKAGKFYQAIKVYMDMIRDIAPNTPAEGSGEAQVDFDKLVVSMFQTWPEKMVKFIAVCSENADNKLTEEKIKEDAYPEQITTAFRTCLTLNRVAENLKNFVAPIGEMGAEVQQIK
jgi:hypothetical protein